MLHILSLSGVQYILVGIGFLLQVMAFTTMKRSTPGFRGDSYHTGDQHAEDEHEEELTPPVLRSPGTHYKPHGVARDYYDTEATPPGVRAADLVKTAKVNYFNDYRAKNPEH